MRYNLRYKYVEMFGLPKTISRFSNQSVNKLIQNIGFFN